MDRRSPNLALCLEYRIADFGGTEVLVRELLHHFHQKYSITLVSADESLVGTPFEPMVHRHIQWRAKPGAAQELVDKLTELKPDIVHFHLGGNYCWNVRNPSECAVTLAGRRGLRVLTTNHGFFSGLEGYCAEYRPLALKLLLLPAAWLAKLAQLHAVKREVAVSQYDYRCLRRWYWPYRAKFRWIHHSRLPSREPEQAGGRREKTIICVGTIGPRKGQTVLVEAFRRIASRFPDWSLELIGRGSDQQMVQQIDATATASGLTERIRRIEGLTDDQIEDRMKTAEIFAMPSRYEGLGLSLQEALYHGCACISTHSGGPEDLMEHGVNGLLIPKEDPSALAEGLATLMESQATREAFRSEGPRSIRAKQMSAPEMGERYRRLYSELPD